MNSGLQLDKYGSPTIRYSLIPTTIQQMKECVRCELACLPHACLKLDLWTN